MGTAANVKLGPGLLYIAPIGTTEPTTLSGSLPSANWTALGYTEEGSTITLDVKYENVEVAEELDPIRFVATGRDVSVKFSLAEISATHLKAALNGGTISSPTGGYVTFDPPALGEEVRTMLVWQSSDNEERWLFRQALQVGTIDIPRKKAPDKALIPCEFKAEVPTTGLKSFRAWFDTDQA